MHAWRPHARRAHARRRMTMPGGPMHRRPRPAHRWRSAHRRVWHAGWAHARRHRPWGRHSRWRHARWCHAGWAHGMRRHPVRRWSVGHVRRHPTWRHSGRMHARRHSARPTRMHARRRAVRGAARWTLRVHGHVWCAASPPDAMRRAEGDKDRRLERYQDKRDRDTILILSLKN